VYILVSYRISAARIHPRAVGNRFKRPWRDGTTHIVIEPLELLRPFAGQFEQISPDGRWLAYSSTETGQSEIYVPSFPSGANRWQVSMTGGNFARWRADGKELYYMSRNNQGKMIAAM
jgi:hypothetical protein